MRKKPAERTTPPTFPPPPMFAPPPTRRLCTAGPAPRVGTVYDLDTQVFEIGPHTKLPVVELPDPGFPREAGDFVRVLEPRRPLLHACYRWARSRDVTLEHARISVALDVDEWGHVTHVGTSGGTDELRSCTNEVLSDLELDRYALRGTHAVGELQFRPSGIGRPRLAPRHPSRTHASTQIPSACVAQPATLPLDELHLAPIVEDDFDEKQDEEQFAAAHHGRRRPSIVVTSRFISCPFFVKPKLSVTPEVARCFAAATARRPGLVGKVTVNAMIAQTGQAVSASLSSSTFSDAALDACLSSALMSKRFEPRPWSEGAVEVSWPLELQSAVDNEPQPTLTTQCDERVEALSVALRAAPWVDEQVVAEARSLEPFLGEPCAHRAAQLLEEQAMTWHKLAQQRRRLGYYERAVSLYRGGLHFDRGNATQHFYLAEALYSLERFDEAALEYVSAVVIWPRGPHAQDALSALGVCIDRLLERT